MVLEDGPWGLHRPDLLDMADMDIVVVMLQKYMSKGCFEWNDGMILMHFVQNP